MNAPGDDAGNLIRALMERVEHLAARVAAMEAQQAEILRRFRDALIAMPTGEVLARVHRIDVRAVDPDQFVEGLVAAMAKAVG